METSSCLTMISLF